MRIFGGITKIEEQDDGSLKVFGVASSGCRPTTEAVCARFGVDGSVISRASRGLLSYAA